jgi:hypothetical protein
VLHASGGLTTIRSSRLEDNTAGSYGGALYAVNYTTINFGDGTLLRGNTAGAGGNSIYPSDEGKSVLVYYTLPAPLGRWVLPTDGGSSALIVQLVETDYPTTCSPGFYGDSTSNQMLPTCTGACPAGHVCPEGTSTPEACPEGAYCPAGSSRAIACPRGRTTLGELAGTEAECVCDTGFFEIADTGGAAESVVCSRCPRGSVCDRPGVTLEGMPLRPGYWRVSDASETPVECPDHRAGGDSGCIGGNGSSCKAGQTGPYCLLCDDLWVDGVRLNASDRYYSKQFTACRSCAQGLAPMYTLAIGGGGGLAAAALCAWLARCIIRRYWQGHSHSMTHSRAIVKMKDKLSFLLVEMRPRLITKLKLCVNFYQVATKLESVYQVSFPWAVSSSLKSFEFVNLNAASFVPLSCVGIGSF